MRKRGQRVFNEHELCSAAKKISHITMVDCHLLPWIVLSIFFPPAVIACSPRNTAEEDESVPGCVEMGRFMFFSLSCFLTCCLWVPGVLFSLWLVFANKDTYTGGTVTCFGSERD